MKLRMILAAVCFCVFVLPGCDKKSSPTEPLPGGSSSMLFVLNGLGKTLSAVDLTTNQVSPTVAVLGTYPNEVVYAQGKLFVVNSGSNTVQVFDAGSYAPAGTIELAAGDNPMNIAVLNSSKAYVACLVTNCVKVLDLAGLRVSKTIPAGIGPTGIAIVNNKVYVTNTGFANNSFGPGTVSVISTTADSVLATINVGANPQAVDIAPDGKVHVVCTGDYMTETGSVSVIDPASDAVVKAIPVGGSPTYIAISHGGLAYLGSFNGTGVATYDSRTYAVVDSMSHQLLGKGGSGIAFDSDGNVFVGDFANDQVIKMDSLHQVKQTYNVGDGPQSLCVK